MRKSLLALVAFVPLAFAQTQTYTYSYSGLPLPVYPDDWNTVAVASILVPRSITISKVTVSVQVQFNNVTDLNVYLFSAKGTRTKLLERNCSGLVNIDTAFDDSAQSKYADFCPVEAGRGPFRGNEPLANSNNENAYGYWKLGVENNGSGLTGYLNSFSVTITGTPFGPPVMNSNTIVSTSSYKSGGVAPGEQLAILGANLGPVGGVWAPAKATLPTSLGATSATFDGVAAPLYFASDRGIIVHAPTTLAAGATTSIKVTSSFGTSTAVTLPIAPARPGIYTYESGGKGQAKAINQDGTLNGDGSIAGSVPTSTGTVLQIWASGLGPVDPPIPTGTITPASPLSRATLPITATIGGQSARITYAGAAPGLVGVYQVNILVPVGVPSGANRLVLYAGDNSSQDEVTVQVK
jgi:uncharacterized protein (TIGR03437 family)